MNQVDIQYHKSSIGELVLGSFEDKLCILDFRYRKMRSTINRRIEKRLKAEFIERNNDILDMTRKQLDEYLMGNRKSFEIPLLLCGTDFQKRVWEALMKVPYGTSSTYLQIAKNIGKEKAVRAVASANGANSIAVIIPCHRIIESNGKLGGYGGGLQMKKKLLELENCYSRDLFNSPIQD